MKLSTTRVFIVVTVYSLIGMVMAGLFGCVAAKISPGLFSTLIPWIELEPVGAATVLGAMVGVVLGGGLGVFAVIIQLLSGWIEYRKGASREG
tara:strand:+ start:1756 stop:2034 length:279 start_codon:yes stop_codon:yes gene_type:complete